MSDLILSATPGVVTFENFEEIRTGLLRYVEANFSRADYEADGADAAVSDRDALKKVRDVIARKQKELKAVYSAPYDAVDKMLEELLAIIDKPYKKARKFAEIAEKTHKREQVMAYARQQAAALGETGTKIVESPAFFNLKWLNKTGDGEAKVWQKQIDDILRQAAADIRSIRAAGGENASVLTAQYYQTLSMDGVKSFRAALGEEQASVDSLAVPSENNVLGYKILKITATEDQMASLLDQLELMGLDVEEIEDGMPKPMKELRTPNFDSFVAFDIETTGTRGAAYGDGEAQITEIGAVRVVNGVVTEMFDELANPGRKIVPRIARLTHISDEMVADKPPVDEIIRRFHAFVGSDTLVGHNIRSSDLRYIVKAAGRAGVHFDVPFLDTYLLAKKFKEQMHWEKLNLGYLAAQYGFEHKEAHRAWSDAEVNAQVYFELQKLCGKKN